MKLIQNWVGTAENLELSLYRSAVKKLSFLATCLITKGMNENRNALFASIPVLLLCNKRVSLIKFS